MPESLDIRPEPNEVGNSRRNSGVQISIVGDGPRYCVSTKSWRVELEEVVGETGRFHAFSESRKRCPRCSARFAKKIANRCPRCGVSLEPEVYFVDAAENRGRTRCACEDFTCNKMAESDPLITCKHGAAALVLLGHLAAAALFKNAQEK